MPNPLHRDPASRHRLTASLALAGALSMAGCGHPGEGAVKVSPEARARLTPRVPSTTRGPNRRIVEQRPIGIKNRGIPSTSIR
jgi:hypothetical protein